MQSRSGPSHNRYSHFRCEEATVTDVDRERWLVKVETKHSAKPVVDVQVLSPYLHWLGGEGYHTMPEVGAVCMLAFPNDNSPPFIMGFKGVPMPSSPPSQGSGDTEEVTMRSRRPRLNPGDQAITTRDANFLILRRGGVVQIGSTPLAQTVYIPIRNYVKHFFENMAMHSPSGDMEWRIERVENDPSGDAPCTFLFHFNEHAQDAKATVRARCFPVGDGEDPKTVWDFAIASKSIDRDTGAVDSPTYTLAIKLDGSKTEFLGANRHVTIDGDDLLEVHGKRTVKTDDDHLIDAGGNATMKAAKAAVLDAPKTHLGSSSASAPVPKGDALVNVLASGQWVASNGMTVTMSPATAVQLRNTLSRYVFTK